MVLSEKQKKIIESYALSNHVERISVWLFDESHERITADSVYSLSENIYLPGFTIEKKDLPIYFEALEENRIFEANDAINDKRTSEFSDIYLKPMGITSMMDVPIIIGEKIVGIICYEHVGAKRIWTNEEKFSATSMADLFALKLETENKNKIYEALIESEQRFGIALSAFPFIFWTTDRDLKITSSRGLGIKKIGLQENSNIGITLYDYFETDDKDYFPILAHLKALNGESLKYEINIRGIILESYVEPLKNVKGEILGCIGMAMDITERKTAEEKIHASEARFRRFVEINNEGIVIYDQGAIIESNPAFSKMFGYEEDEVIGMHPFQFTAPDWIELMRQNMAKQVTYPFEVLGLRKDGSTFHVELHGRIIDYNGKGVSVVTVKDISTIKKAMEDVFKSEQQLASILNTVPDVIFVLNVEDDGHFKFESVNKSFLLTHNLSLNEVVGKNVEEIVPEPFLSLHLGKYQEAINNKKTVYWEYTGGNPPNDVSGIVTVVPRFDDDGKCLQLIGTVKDITERKKIENSLKASEELTRSMIEASIDAVITINNKGTITGWNGKAQEILGWSVSEAVGVQLVNLIIPIKYREAHSKGFKKFFETGEGPILDKIFETTALHKDGHEFPVDLSIAPFKLGNTIAFCGYLRDITERKKAEETYKKLNVELEQRVQERTSELQSINKELEKARITAEESKASKELFLASMSHEIRTPLNAIIGFQQLLKDTPLNIEQKEYIESIDFAGRNLLVIINDILDLSKIEAGKFQFDEVEFNITDITKSVVELIGHRAKEKNIKLYLYHDSAIPMVLYGDSTRLSQILLNLLGNAIKFTEKGEVKVTTNLVEETNDYALCELSVEDTGIGISEDKLALVFERFTQESGETSRKYGGTGLGLTISKYLVELQGGSIHAQSELGKGSIFTFQLKFRKVPSKTIKTKSSDRNFNENNEAEKKLNILLAEDVPLNQRLVVKIMEKWGHQLDIADNGKIAIEKVQNNYYDIILMDIQMPEMDGYQATTFIRSLPDKLKQTVPIIAFTAEASQAEAEKCINLGMNAYIAKPFNQNNLRQIITKLTSENKS